VTLPFEEVTKLARAVELLEKRHIRGAYGVDKGGEDLEESECIISPELGVGFCGVGALRAAGVKQATLEAFSGYLIERSRAIRLHHRFLPGEKVMGDEAESIIIDTNDDMPNGPKLIRKYMRDFIHANC